MMKLPYLNVKRFLILCGLSLLCLGLKAQDIKDNFIVFGKVEMPSLAIQPVEGGSSTNLKELKNIVKYPEKPTLVIFWAYKWCYPCLRLIDTLLKNNLDKQYNFITVNIEEGHYGGSDLQEINKLITERSGWNRISHFQANLKSYEELIGTSDTPHLLFIDKKGAIVDSFLGYVIGYKDIIGSLNVINTGQYSVNGKFYRDKVLTNASDGKTYTLKSVVDNHVVLTTYDKVTNMVSSYFTFMIRENKLLGDGTSKSFYGNGKAYYDGLFKNGEVLKFKRWFVDGTIQQDFNMPFIGEGYGKTWNEDGSKQSFARYVDRKRQGLTTEYYKDITYEFTYKDDVIVLEKRYKNGVLEKETKYVAGKAID